MKKKVKLILCVLCVTSIFTLTTPAMATQREDVIIDNENSFIQPRTDIKEWKYAVIDGNLYKRLYNYSTGRWETDWILVAYGN